MMHLFLPCAYSLTNPSFLPSFFPSLSLRYTHIKLPRRLPAPRAPITPNDIAQRDVSSLIGYLEQSIGTAITKALKALSDEREALKHPALSVSGSALAFLALSLKAAKPNELPRIAKRQQQRLEQFLAECRLAEEIRAKAPRGSGRAVARASPRQMALVEEFDKVSRDTVGTLKKRLLRP